MKAVKKPVEIDYFPVIVTEIGGDNLELVKEWVDSFGEKDWEDNFEMIDQGPDGLSLRVKTLEGTSYDVTSRDVIIRGVKGEYYPCKKDIFEQTYNRI